jgi:hypothetical protein
MEINKNLLRFQSYTVDVFQHEELEQMNSNLGVETKYFKVLNINI